MGSSNLIETTVLPSSPYCASRFLRRIVEPPFLPEHLVHVLGDFIELPRALIVLTWAD